MSKHPPKIAAATEAFHAYIEANKITPNEVIVVCAIVQADFIAAAYPNDTATAATIANTALERALADVVRK